MGARGHPYRDRRVLNGIETQLRPEMGWIFLLPLFAAIILGGKGSITGALAGGLILGIASRSRLSSSSRPTSRGRVHHHDTRPDFQAQGDLREEDIHMMSSSVGGIINFIVAFAIMASIYAIFSIGLNVHWGYTGS